MRQPASLRAESRGRRCGRQVRPCERTRGGRPTNLRNPALHAGLHPIEAGASGRRIETMTNHLGRLLAVLSFSAIACVSASTASHADEGTQVERNREQRLDAKARRLDRRGDGIERRHDLRGDRIDRRLDRASRRAERHGHDARARRLDRRGERIDRRLDVRGDRRNQRLDRRASRIGRRAG